ncbi:hypothetical protein ACHAQI_008848 [Fusarium lateritium]
MLPGALVGAVRQYKEDTDSVAAWLASSAKLCGYQSSLSDTNQALNVNSDQKGRLKGKSRKEAKNNAAEARTNTDIKYTVAIADFVPMAECIFASKKPLVHIPGSFVTVLRRVIRLRSSFGSRLTKLGIDRSAEADSSHEYFVGILQRVEEVLEPKFPVTQRQKVSQKSKQDISKGFDLLRVFEPSQQFQNAPAIERPQRTQEDRTVYIAETRDAFEDALTMWHLLMSDVDELRTQIRWAWQGYLDNDFDITAAAIATDVGIHMAQDLVDQSSELFQKHGGIHEIAQKHFEQTAIEQGFTQEDVAAFNNNYNKDKSLYTLYDKTFCQAIDLVEPLLPMNAYSASFSPADVLRKVDPLNEAQVMTMRFWLEAVLFTRDRVTFSVTDEYLHSILEANDTNKVSFHLAFANQIRLDIHQMFDGNCGKGFQTLQTHIDDMIDQINTFLETLPKWGTPKCPHSLQKHIESCKVSFEAIMQDDGLQAIRYRQEVRSIGAGPIESHMALRLSPVHAGVVLFHARADMFRVAFLAIKNTGVLTSTSHLYHAVQQMGLVEQTWPDIETFESCFDPSDFFLAGKPKSPDDFYKRLLLQLGAPVSMLHGKKRPKSSGNTTTFKFSVHGMQEGALVSLTYDRTHQDLDDIVSVSLYKESVSGEGTTVFGPLSVEDRKQAKKLATQPKSKAPGRSPIQSPELLLRSFTLALAAEARELAFPYFRMYNTSVRVLTKVEGRAQPFLEDKRRAIPEDETVSSTVLRIFENLSVGKDDRPLHEAVPVIKKLVSGRRASIASSKIANIPKFPRSVPELHAWTKAPLGLTPFKRKGAWLDLNISGLVRSAEGTREADEDATIARYNEMMGHSPDQTQTPDGTYQTVPVYFDTE